MQVEINHREFLEEKFQEVMKNHLCGNYISIDDNSEVEWFTNYDTEQFITLTEFGSYHHQYDWDFSYDSNLATFVEGVIEFVLDNKEKQ